MVQQQRIRILMSEDNPADAELELRELKRAGLIIDHRLAIRPDDFRRAIAEFSPQLIVSDFNMPGFDGMEALRLSRELAPDIPFIFVSGTLGEEYAIRALKSGASDYVLKTNLIRLPSVIERSLVEAAERRARRLAEAGLRKAQVMAKLGHVITGEDGAFESWSESLPDLIGAPGGALPRSTREWMNGVHADDRATFREAALRAASTGARVDVEYRLRRADGRWIHVRQAMEPLERARAESSTRWFSTLQDVTEQKEAAQRLDFLANFDALTGLANRKRFTERLDEVLASAEGASRAVVVLDVERFKSINDSLGRAAGDALLSQLGERLVAMMRDSARVARTGADQFALMISAMPSAQSIARGIEEGFRRLEGTPFDVGAAPLRAAVRCGVAVHPADGQDAESLFRHAEAALKKAKQSGQKYLFFRQDMTERVAERLALENRLRVAVEREEFVLHYQPKVDLEKRRVAGLEALMRWQSPEGMVPPLQFIPILEETGLIAQVGTWALRRAALDRRAWLEAGLEVPRVAVNVSPIQLRQADFVSRLEEALRDGARPPGVDLEITESLVMEDVARSVEVLRRVRELGVDIAIDDFGTGYSSLAYLSRLPVQELKIDRSFVAGMERDANAMTLVSTMVSLAHSLGLRVVAEGVETEAQASKLQLLRCDAMQGYLVSKPVAAAAIPALLG